MNDVEFFHEAMRADVERIKRKLPKNVRVFIHLDENGKRRGIGWDYKVTSQSRHIDQAFSIFEVAGNFYLKIHSFEWILDYQRKVPKDQQQFNLEITGEGILIQDPPFETPKEAYERSLLFTSMFDFLH